MSQVKAFNTLHSRQKYRATYRKKLNNFDNLVDVDKETQRLYALINVNCLTLKCFPSDTTSGYHIAPFVFKSR